MVKKYDIPYHVAGIILFLVTYVAASLTTLVSQQNIMETVLIAVAVSGSVLIFMTATFMISRLLGRTDLVDGAWGLAFVTAAISSFLIGNSGANSVGWNIQTITTGLVLIWGLRLAYTIGRRLATHPEDKRYVELRKHWRGNQAVNTYVRIFFTQAVLATTISIAVIIINTSQAQLPSTLAYIGIVVWLIGFLFEATGDAQLKKYIANPENKGTLMTSGLWKYTRHPNYFGEATLWWGIFIIALATPYGLAGIITPVLITYLLCFVSGVPTTEKHFEGRSGWGSYKKRTSMFIPLPPREP